MTGGSTFPAHITNNAFLSGVRVLQGHGVLMPVRAGFAATVRAQYSINFLILRRRRSTTLNPLMAYTCSACTQEGDCNGVPIFRKASRCFDMVRILQNRLTRHVLLGLVHLDVILVYLLELLIGSPRHVRKALELTSSQVSLTVFELLHVIVLIPAAIPYV